MKIGQSRLGDCAYCYQHKCDVHDKFYDANGHFGRAIIDIFVNVWIGMYSIVFAYTAQFWLVVYIRQYCAPLRGDDIKYERPFRVALLGNVI